MKDYSAFKNTRRNFLSNIAMATAAQVVVSPLFANNTDKIYKINKFRAKLFRSYKK